MFSVRVGLLFSFAACAVIAQDGSGLRITSVSPLPPGVVDGTYFQTLSAAGGAPPYSWGLLTGTLPSGLTLSTNGSITGVPTTVGTSTMTIQVADSAASRVSQTFSVSIIAAGTLARSGVLSHIAAGGTWSTAITLVNSSPQPVPVRVNFRAGDGSAWNLPLVVTQQGGSQAVGTAVLDGVLNPNTSLLIETGALTSTAVGWAEVLSPGPVGGFAIFRSSPPSGPSSEGTVPLQTQSPTAVVLPYDNTSGFVMGVAFANPSTIPADITAAIWDEQGSPLGTQTILLPARGHTAFIMPTQLPPTAGKRGIVRFQTTGTGGIAALGLRFSPFGTFTSVPGL